VPFNPKDFYTYFKECYKLDFKEFNINNILSSKHSYKWFVPQTEELLHDQLPLIPYTNKKAEDLQKEITLYNLEKKLFYGCFFILGKNENPFIKDKRIACPLLLFPATIQNLDEEKFLRIDRDQVDINRSAITLLDLNEELIEKDRFVQLLIEKVNSEDNFFGLKNILDKYITNVETEDLLMFPTTWSAQKTRIHLSKKTYEPGNYKIIPAAGTILVEKSESSLRVLNDLNEMAKKADFNSSIENLLTNQEKKFSFGSSYYKSRLNTEQYKALKNAYQYTNSVIVGPPGTGKTYTINSIISDALINNQSVLVVSKTKQAVEVLREMLKKDFQLQNYIIHTTGVNYKVSLKAKVKRYLSGIASRRKVNISSNRLEVSFHKLENLEEEFKEFIDKELKLSDLEFNENLSLWEKWQKFYLNNFGYQGTQIWSIFEEINVLLNDLEKELRIYSKQKISANIRNNSQSYRKDLSLFYDALDSSSFSEYKRILKDVNHENILKIFPIWLANLSDLNSILPLEKNIFDLVIIDEATQCDIASALPALYRAKRTVIAGDPNQLKHYSFVSGAKQRNLQKSLNLPKDKIFDYRNRSVLDLYIAKVQQQNQVSFLREHFRSTPSLIEFSNQQFYEGNLEVLKSTPNHTNHQQIETILVSGIRDKKGINNGEAKAVLKKLDEIIKKYEHETQKPSIGIISPFNSQVTYLKKLLRNEYELFTLKQFDVLCGTPYHFQGSEREIVLLSFCVCDETHHSAFIHLNKPEVLNVAITRAKSYQYLFTSVTEFNKKQESLFYKYLSFVENFSHTNKQEKSLDNFQKEVVSALEKHSFLDVQCGYPVAGSLLDILVTKNHENYFIDLIGYPGIFKEAFTLERYKTLARTGIKSLPLHYSFWKKNKEEAIQKMIEFIN